MIKWICVITITFCIGHFIDNRSGQNEGARQMARHILNPVYETEGFYAVMNEECGQSNGILRVNGCTTIFKEGITINAKNESFKL